MNGSSVYRQWIGIPIAMGTDCAPFLANLYLFALEYKYVQKLLNSKDKQLAYAFNNTSRYIDDLLTINKKGLLDTHKFAIYPPSLTLNKENSSDHHTHFLDLNLTLNDNRIKLSLYDKRDDFPFEVISFPDLSGNISFSHSHGIIIGQLRRYAKACDHYSHFRNRARLVTTKLLNQGFDKSRLSSKITTFYSRYNHLISKYAIREISFVKDCFA